MDKKRKRSGKNLWRHLVGLGAIITWCMAGCVGRKAESASIGIIGGADGPTAIFVTVSPNPIYGAAAVVLLVLGLVVCWKLIRRSRNKNE